MIKGLEGKLYKEELRELCIFMLEKRDQRYIVAYIVAVERLPQRKERTTVLLSCSE